MSTLLDTLKTAQQKLRESCQQQHKPYARFDTLYAILETLVHEITKVTEKVTEPKTTVFESVEEVAETTEIEAVVLLRQNRYTKGYKDITCFLQKNREIKKTCKDAIVQKFKFKFNLQAVKEIEIMKKLRNYQRVYQSNRAYVKSIYNTNRVWLSHVPNQIIIPDKNQWKAYLIDKERLFK